MTTVFKTYGEVREHALNYWLEGTGRELREHKGVQVDTFCNGIECRWQSMARATMHDENYHVCTFCSIGNNAKGISKFLLNDTYDHFLLNNFCDRDILFLHYQEFYRKVIDLIEDLTDLAKFFDKRSKKQVRDGLSPLVDTFIGYGNTVCKHSFGKSENVLHKQDHHLPKFIEGIEPEIKGVVLSIKNYNLEKSQIAKAVVMPEISKILYMVLCSYSRISHLMLEKPDRFKVFCEKYGEVRIWSQEEELDSAA